MIVGTTAEALLSAQAESDGTAARTKNLSEAREVPILSTFGLAVFVSNATLVRKKRVLCLKQLGKGQAKESMWGMPGHTEAMKAAVSCDKLGGAAHTH